MIGRVSVCEAFSKIFKLSSFVGSFVGSFVCIFFLAKPKSNVYKFGRYGHNSVSFTGIVTRFGNKTDFYVFILRLPFILQTDFRQSPRRLPFLPDFICVFRQFLSLLFVVVVMQLVMDMKNGKCSAFIQNGLWIELDSITIAANGSRPAGEIKFDFAAENFNAFNIW